MAHPTPPPSRSPFAPYKLAIQAISTRTGAPLPSLVLSFAVLHELTAIAPFLAIFFGARQFGVGERVITAITSDSDSSGGGGGALKQKSREWMSEGEVWAERVGRRYGVFGFEKRGTSSSAGSVSAEDSDIRAATAQNTKFSPNIAGDVANAVVAYGITKVRIVIVLSRTTGD